MAMKKEWKEIKGYEGKYIVSNYGEVISLPRLKQNNSKKQYVEPKELSKNVSSTNGYVYVLLCNKGKCKNVRLHKLVAEAFIPNPYNLPQINHKDGNKQNNKVDNLKWCTCQENIRHAYNNGLASNKNKIKIQKCDLNGICIEEFNSILEASLKTKVSIGSISLCINNKRKTAGKYIWKKVF